MSDEVNDEGLDEQWESDDEDFEDDDDEDVAPSESGPVNSGNGHEARGDESADRPSRSRRRGGRSAEEAPFEGDERAREALDFVSGVVREMEMECRVRLRRPRD